MSMTPEAKSHLSATIRALRSRLLEDLHAATDSAYRLSVPLKSAGLGEPARIQRQRLEGWLEEQVRTEKKAKGEASRARFRLEVEKEAAYTLLNRLVFLRLLEAAGLSRPEVVTGGWESKGYRELREWAPALLADETEGYATLLGLLFDELAHDLPGLYGNVGLTSLVPVPSATLRAVVEALNDPALASCWTDDTTLGWVYQYWNDPEREALDAKIAGGGKIEPHEIASKTQMFTERYMVEWLLQNSLGPMWLAMCRKHGWIADAEGHGVLASLEERRTAWRARRETGDVALDALMPLESEAEERWAYYVPQPIPEDAIEHAPASVRELKLLDPACGSGHFLVSAFDLLVALYREEAGHRGEAWGEREIAESILERNLHGIDIDPRAVQIAAAALYLKARRFCREAQPARLNLVAPTLRLASLPGSDPALEVLYRQVEEATGMPEQLTFEIVQALEGADHLGSLLKVDAAVEEAIRQHDRELVRTDKTPQGDLFSGFAPRRKRISAEQARASVMARLEEFLARHTGGEDLGLRLHGEQLAAGIRFVRMIREGSYDVVVGNPPYQGTSKMADGKYVAMHYPRGKADLYAAFLERGLELCRPGGFASMVTMQGWMFLGQFEAIRRWVIEENSLRTLADMRWCAFEHMRHATVSMAAVMRGPSACTLSVAVAPTPRDEREESIPALHRKRAGVLAQVGRHEFDPKGFGVIEGEPIVYWWSKEFLERYAAAPKLGQSSPARFGLNSGNNTRFLRKTWEIKRQQCSSVRTNSPLMPSVEFSWTRYMKGSGGVQWIDPCDDVCVWYGNGLQVKVLAAHLYGSYTRQIRNESFYFGRGVGFAMIGAAFSARAHRWRAVIDGMAASLYPEDVGGAVCLMNSASAKYVLQSLNPTVHFQVGDVNRLPVFPVANSDEIFRTIEHAFTLHESAREPSVEFKSPGPSPWRYAQDWAQRAVDRPDGKPLPPYEPEHDPPAHESFVSFAVGVALGRFGAKGEGILDDAPATALPAGILFLSADEQDSLDHPACGPLRGAWDERGAAVGQGEDLRTYLRKSFFDYHKKLYESRPIYFPLSSAKKSFVAWVSIHRWAEDTLRTLLADHLLPCLKRIEGQLEDLRQARGAPDRKKANAAERQYASLQKLYEELLDFIQTVTTCAEKGPPPPDSKTPAREKDARYIPDLDDSVMVNSAALWPLLEPQWKDPKKWWRELAAAQGRKDYDWSHLAARYFPTRVDGKCKEDPSLAVAHHCFWKYHPARAYAWELRLQDEIRPDFTIDEPGSDETRAAFLRAQPEEVAAIEEKERKRRERRARGAGEEEQAQGSLDYGDEAQGEEQEQAERDIAEVDA